jgi:hypothetical protein
MYYFPGNEPGEINLFNNNLKTGVAHQKPIFRLRNKIYFFIDFT